MATNEPTFANDKEQLDNYLPANFNGMEKMNSGIHLIFPQNLLDPE